VAPTRNVTPPVDAPAPPLPRPVNTRTIELDRFISEDEIDRRYLDTPYYVVPREEVGEEAFAVIREAMRERHVAGMGRVMLQTRERPIIVFPMGSGLCGVTLRYAHEVREAAEFFSPIPEIDLPHDMVETAAMLIDKKGGSFDPAYLEDRYRTVLVERLRRKTESLPEKSKAKNTEARSQNVIDLMAALKRSVVTEKIQKPVRPRNNRDAKPAPRRAAAATKSTPTKRSRSRSR
jgi:Ku protein